MDFSPTEIDDQAREASRSRLNAMVAVTIALLASFMGVCKVKDDNIVQAMQKDQADKIDAWGYYEAKNTQAKLLSNTAELLEVEAASLPAAQRQRSIRSAAGMRAKAAEEESKKEEFGEKARAYDEDYDRLNYRDDQFDLCDALLALAVTLLAITSLTQKRWLFWAALVPTALGVLMGLAGLLGWHLHPGSIMNLLSSVVLGGR